MAETFNNQTTNLEQSTFYTIYTAPNSASTDRAIVMSILCANVDSALETRIDIQLLDKDGAPLTYVAKQLIIPLNATLDAVANKIVLTNGQSIRARTDLPNSLDITVSSIDFTGGSN